MGKAIISYREARRRLGDIGHTRFFEDIKAGLLPKPVSLGGRRKGLVESELNAYIDRRIADRDSAAG